MLVVEDKPDEIAENMRNATIASFQGAPGTPLDLVGCRDPIPALGNSLLDALNPVVPLLMQKNVFFYMLEGSSFGAAGNDRFTYEQIDRMLLEVYPDGKQLPRIPAVAKLKELWVSVLHGSHEQSSCDATQLSAPSLTDRQQQKIKVGKGRKNIITALVDGALQERAEGRSVLGPDANNAHGASDIPSIIAVRSRGLNRRHAFFKLTLLTVCWLVAA